MSNFAQLVEEDRRLALLRFLSEAAQYEANESLLRSALDLIGHNVSRDRVRADIAWLCEQGLVRSENVADLVVCTITQRGQDVAAGRAVHPGVKRPGPRG